MLRIPCLMVALAAAAAALADPVSFEDALTRAEQRAPALAASDAGALAAREEGRAAGRLPDPSVFVGLEGYPVSGPHAWSATRDSMTTQKVGLFQRIPNAGKRSAERAARAADHALVEAERRERRIAVRTGVAVAWIEGYHLRRRRALLDALETEARILRAAVEAALGSGGERGADAYLPILEEVEIADRRDELARAEAGVAARLKRYLGPVALEDLAGAPPEFRLDEEELRRHLVHHAAIARYGAEIERADAALQEAVAARRPDWGLEVAFQRRDADFGDMVSVQLSIDLPVSPATRQDPVIEARWHTIDRILAERDDRFDEHERELEELLAGLKTVTRQLERLNATLLPALDHRVEVSNAAYSAGNGELRELLDARRDLIGARLRGIELESRRQVFQARLHYAYEEDRS